MSEGISYPKARHSAPSLFPYWYFGYGYLSERKYDRWRFLRSRQAGLQAHEAVVLSLASASAAVLLCYLQDSCRWEILWPGQMQIAEPFQEYEDRLYIWGKKITKNPEDFQNFLLR